MSRPLPPLPWLWPLTALVFAALGAAGVVFTEMWSEVPPEVRGSSVPVGLLLPVLGLAAGQLALSLPLALICLFALRNRAARDGNGLPRLAAFWGLCCGLGLAVALWMSGSGVGALLCLSLPLLGYALGRGLGRRKAAG